MVARDGDVERWDLGPLKAALKAGLLPVIHGDVIFDSVRGGTILSTEDLFTYLARQIHPNRMLLAGIESGVWDDFPNRSTVIPKITPHNYLDVLPALGGAAATDVTGGMESKVEQSLLISREIPEMDILIFSGDEPGTLRDVLLGSSQGTVISSLE